MNPKSAATYERMTVPLSITLPIDSSPCEKETPSTAVGTEGNVLSTLFASRPLENAVYFFGSKVSVCGIPPAIHNRITVSAFEVIFFLLQEDRKLLIGAPAANVASVAALVFLINSLRFQSFILQNR